MRQLISIIGLELYALCLAAEHYLGHVHTDEAKYLLNIPYPHPPLVRSLLSVLDGFSFQEFLIRFLFASIVAQAAWLAWDMGRDKTERVVLAAAWLLSWGVLSQTGTVMMAPLTAVQGLVFAWLYSRGKDDAPFAGLIALFWLGSLFTAYQAFLFFPIACAVFWKMKLPLWKGTAYVVVPVILLCLYTFTNPLAFVSILGRGDVGGDDPSARIHAFLSLWSLAGNVIIGVMGTVGLAMSGRKAVIASYLLVCLYVFLGGASYYAVLFLPFFIAGLPSLFRLSPFAPSGAGIAVAVSALVILFAEPIVNAPTPAREVMDVVAGWRMEGIVLIQGDFGHDWQYESRFPVYRYKESLVPRAQAVICLEEPCPVRGNPAFHEFPDMPVGVWMRQ